MLQRAWEFVRKRKERDRRKEEEDGKRKRQRYESQSNRGWDDSRISRCQRGSKDNVLKFETMLCLIVRLVSIKWYFCHRAFAQI